MTARTVLRPELLRADTQAFFKVLNNEPDISVVVVSVSFVDACLASLLHASMRKSNITDRLLDSRRGAIGSFSARADLAYALNLVEKPMYQNLLQLAEIRNLVAHHHIAIGFDDVSISSACLNLDYLLTMKNGDLDEFVFKPEALPPAKERFKFTAVVLSDHLLRKSEALGAEAPKG